MNRRTLLFSTGSPFARAVRIVLDELELEYEKKEEITTASVEERAKSSPTLQVPTLWDAGIHLWESTLIVEYLMQAYSARRPEGLQLAGSAYRGESIWRDKLVTSTVQTLGTAITTLSQMTLGGSSIQDSTYLVRSLARLPYLVSWLEGEVDSPTEGFIPGVLSAQDIFLTCHLDFAANRPLGFVIDLSNCPKLRALSERVRRRRSAKINPILWWEPGVVGYEDDGTPIMASES